MQWLGSLICTVLALFHAVWQRLVSGVGSQRRTAGQGLVEYALVLVLIAVVVIGAVSATGKRVTSVYRDVDCGLAGAQSKGGSSNSVNACNSTNPGNGSN